MTTVAEAQAAHIAALQAIIAAGEAAASPLTVQRDALVKSIAPVQAQIAALTAKIKATDTPEVVAARQALGPLTAMGIRFSRPGPTRN